LSKQKLPQGGSVEFLIAPDSFKGSLSAPQAARAIASGLKRALPQVATRELPLADGGEGSAETLRAALGGERVEVGVQDPLGRSVRACYVLLDGGRVAAIEVAQASGLTRLNPDGRDPLRASSYGTGELLSHALDRGVEAIWVGLGGSATVDGGLGLACALGARGVDDKGQDVPPNGRGLVDLDGLDLRRLDPRLQHVQVVALCDVDNTLCGPQGARLFMAQKGADAALSAQLDAALARWAQVLLACTGRDVAALQGAGAAGGLGAGLAALLGAELVSGAQFVLEHSGFERVLAETYLVVTGEGRVDEQTAHGKLVAAVAQCAKRHGVPVVVLCGSKGEDLQALYDMGVDAVFSIIQHPCDETQALERAAAWLEEGAYSLGQVLKLAGCPTRRSPVRR